MQIGYSTISNHPVGTSPEAAAETILGLTEAARRAGVDYVQVGDHHLLRDSFYFQNLPLAGRLTGDWDSVALFAALPYYHPALIAEYAGTLGSLVSSFDLWVSIGSQDAVFEALQIPKSDRVSRFAESVRVIRSLLSHHDVSFDGDHYSFEDVSINPKTDCRICVAGSAPDAVRRAAHLGDAWVASPFETRESFETKFDIYEDAGGTDAILRRDVLVRSDSDTAAREVRETLDSTDEYRGTEHSSDRLVYGSPAEVATEIEDYRNLGASEIAIRPLSHDNGIETMDHLGSAIEMI